MHKVLLSLVIVLIIGLCGCAGKEEATEATRTVRLELTAPREERTD